MKLKVKAAIVLNRRESTIIAATLQRPNKAIEHAAKDTPRVREEEGVIKDFLNNVERLHRVLDQA